MVAGEFGRGMTAESTMRGKALWYVGPGRAELREEAVPALKTGDVKVRALFGAISRGTERLVHAGRVPASEYDRMRAPFMGGAFPFPVKYGYATAGRVEEDRRIPLTGNLSGQSLDFGREGGVRRDRNREPVTARFWAAFARPAAVFGPVLC